MVMAAQITETSVGDGGDSLTLTLTPLQDTILPVPLSFEPPLQALGSDVRGFRLHWQQLTHLFHFENPATFSDISAALTDRDVRLLVRFVETCCKLARYSSISALSSVTVSTHRDGTSCVQAELPNEEAFAGFSVTFRQLHNHSDEASFDKAWKVLNTALNALMREGKDLERDRDVLASWKQARNKLKAKTATTLICETLVPDPVGDRPLSLKGIVPDEIIHTYNYGDTLHWGQDRERYTELTRDPTHKDFYRFCCLTSMVSLSHLYFGFAAVIAAALGRELPSAGPTADL